MGVIFLISFAHQPLTLGLVYGDPLQRGAHRRLYRWAPWMAFGLIIVGLNVSLSAVALMAGLVERRAHADAALRRDAHLRPQGRRRPRTHREADADRLARCRALLHRRLRRSAATGPQARLRWHQRSQRAAARRPRPDRTRRLLGRPDRRSRLRRPLVAGRAAPRCCGQPSEALVRARHRRSGDRGDGRPDRRRRRLRGRARHRVLRRRAHARCASAAMPPRWQPRLARRLGGQRRTSSTSWPSARSCTSPNRDFDGRLYAFAVLFFGALHILYDGFVWKLRRPAVAASLGITPPAQLELDKPPRKRSARASPTRSGFCRRLPANHRVVLSTASNIAATTSRASRRGGARRAPRHVRSPTPRAWPLRPAARPLVATSGIVENDWRVVADHPRLVRCLRRFGDCGLDQAREASRVPARLRRRARGTDRPGAPSPAAAARRPSAPSSRSGGRGCRRGCRPPTRCRGPWCWPRRVRRTARRRSTGSRRGATSSRHSIPEMRRKSSTSVHSRPTWAIRWLAARLRGWLAR